MRCGAALLLGAAAEPRGIAVRVQRDARSRVLLRRRCRVVLRSGVLGCCVFGRSGVLWRRM